MPYDDKQLTGYVLLVDAQGGASDDVSAPDAGQTLLYTTEQGLVAERPSQQWFCDAPVLLSSLGAVVLTDTAQSILDNPFTVPDDIDASFPTVYRIDAQVLVENFVPAATSVGIYVVALLDGAPAGPAVIIPCDGATGGGGGCVSLLVTGSEGEVLDIAAYLIDASDAADATLYIGTIRRDLRIFP